jgi:deoxyribodipyrimidine photo-lyase
MPKAKNYETARNFPAVEGTSGLSVHLRFGTISPRELVRRALSNGSDGADKWLSEVIWRDFYHAILGHFPIAATESFDPLYRDLDWPGTQEHFQAWCDGQTGYPIIDSAMRCLNATGWMHNRLRMIVASFLTKDLLVDYRKGESYFAEKLLDFDLAANNGGWQWAASTGCDAQPYFRVFNPYLQSEKFDAEGKFIREWVPELASLKGKEIHNPPAMVAMSLGYPVAIVEHSVQRDEAIKLLASVRKKG